MGKSTVKWTKAKNINIFLLSCNMCSITKKMLIFQDLKTKSTWHFFLKSQPVYSVKRLSNICMKTHFVKHVVCRFIKNLYKQKASYIVLAHYSARCYTNFSCITQYCMSVSKYQIRPTPTCNASNQNSYFPSLSFVFL